MRTVPNEEKRTVAVAWRPSSQTHEVLNQAPPLTPYDVFCADTALGEAVDREGGGWGVNRLRDAGALAGTPEALEHSERAERNEPRLRTHDRCGHRVDEVELDPSWHWLLRQAVERGIHSLPWREPRAGAQWCARGSCSCGARSTRALCAPCR